MNIHKRLMSKLRHILNELRLTEAKRERVLRSHYEAFESVGLNFDTAAARAASITDCLEVGRTDDSMHYELFAGFSLLQNVENILEIGTASGYFTQFLAHLFPQASIETWDLPVEALTDSSVESYSRISEGYGRQFESIQKRLDSIPNIVRIKRDSTNLTFRDGSFDLIWVDGDHTYPVVAFDVINALRLVGTGGRICVDDIRLREARDSKLGSRETYWTVKHLEGSGLVSLQFIMKRIDSSSMSESPENRKYIAVIQRLM